MRFSGKGWAMLAAVVMVAVISQVALAQREEGGRRGRGGPGGPRGGMFGPPTAGRLLGSKEVQDALKLTDDQKSKIEKINDEMRDEMRKAFQDGGDRDKMVELAKSTSGKINEVLDEGQRKRLIGILIQVNGPAAIADPSVASELNITDDQKAKLQEVRMGAREAMEKNRDLSGDERDKKNDEIQADVNKKILAVLTTDQQSQLESLKGEKVDVNVSQLRGGPGGRGGDRPRGERGGRRDRGGESKGEEKSSN